MLINKNKFKTSKSTGSLGINEDSFITSNIFYEPKGVCLYHLL
ncbi:hypothetical protein PTUN_b0895 [Pseudoalteromonas tunicata]|nr:hypothetical protein PTUN_b0895 [Pseudoalteromonas tunicata]